MGFTPEEKQYKIDFEEGHALHGLHIVMGSLTLGEYNSMMKRGLVKGANEETLKANDEMIDLFVSKIVSWDLEDAKGNPVPTTREGVDSQDRNYIGQMINAWQMAMLGISELLGKGSLNGSQSLEESLGLGT
jgi:hypothetical protein